MLTADVPANAIPKETRKNISGLSYRLMLSEKWNVSAFGKYYNQFVAGPIATSTAEDEYVRTTRTVDAWGYGAAGTYFITKGLQVKASYEKAYRLPTNEEMFGDEDLEMGDIGLKPENSDNINLNIFVEVSVKKLVIPVAHILRGKLLNIVFIISKKSVIILSPLRLMFPIMREA